MPVLRRLPVKPHSVNSDVHGTSSASEANAACRPIASKAGSGASTPSAAKAAKSHARKREEGHIPRPRNAFIIFRTDFVAKGVVPMCVETHSQNLSRIAGQVWKSMSPPERMVWFERAAEEKRRHAEKYPGYQYHPSDPYTLRNKRKVQKGRGTRELKAMDAWCTEVAGLLVQGTDGEQLVQVMGSLETRKKIANSEDLLTEAPKADSISAATTRVVSPTPLDSQPLATFAPQSSLSHPAVSSREITPSSPSTLSSLSSSSDSPRLLPPVRTLPPSHSSTLSGSSTLKHRPSLPFPGALIVPDKPRSSTSTASSPASSTTTRSDLCPSPLSAFQVPDYFASVQTHPPRAGPVRFGETWCPRPQEISLSAKDHCPSYALRPVSDREFTRRRCPEADFD